MKINDNCRKNRKKQEEHTRVTWFTFHDIFYTVFEVHPYDFNGRGHKAYHINVLFRLFSIMKSNLAPKQKCNFL